MKLLHTSPDAYGFEFDPHEARLFFKVLARYPLIPSGHHRLSRNPEAGAAGGENQALLEEALAAHREETRQKVRRLTGQAGQPPATGTGFRWNAARADLEWVLQVLNDVRVGSWLALGSPHLQTERSGPVTAEQLAHYWAMDIAGGFEMIFIAALGGDLPVEGE